MGLHGLVTDGIRFASGGGKGDRRPPTSKGEPLLRSEHDRRSSVDSSDDNSKTVAKKKGKTKERHKAKAKEKATSKGKTSTKDKDGNAANPLEPVSKPPEPAAEREWTPTRTGHLAVGARE